MSELPINLIVELIVAVLLVLTLCYAFVLNRRIRGLKSEEHELHAMINELNRTAINAENAVRTLKRTTADTEHRLSQRLDHAFGTKEGLENCIVAGNKLIDQLTKIVEAGGGKVAYRRSRLGRAKLARQANNNETAIVGGVKQNLLFEEDFEESKKQSQLG